MPYQYQWKVYTFESEQSPVRSDDTSSCLRQILLRFQKGSLRKQHHHGSSNRIHGCAKEPRVAPYLYVCLSFSDGKKKISQRKCRYMMHPPKQFSFGISICSVCSWRPMPKCQIQNKGKFVRRRLVMFWTSQKICLLDFRPRTRHGFLTWSLRARTSRTSGPSLRHDRQRRKSCDVSRQGDSDSVLGHRTAARRLPGLWH